MFLATGGEDASIILSPALRMKPVFLPTSIEGHPQTVKDMSFWLKNPNEGFLFSVGGFGSLKAWRLNLIERPDGRVEMQSVGLATCPPMK